VRKKSNCRRNEQYSLAKQVRAGRIYDTIKREAAPREVCGRERIMDMKEQLEKAYASAARGDFEPLRESAEQIKRLPRTAEGIFDTSSVDSDCFRAARIVYPVYAAFETECNKEEGYPDLLAQLRILDERQKKSGSLEAAADFLDMLMSVIENVTPQLYEYYRELVDMFRADIKETIRSYYDEAEQSFGGAEGKASGADGKIRGAAARAGKSYVLLAEKYQKYM
jgi:hypothetical protein